MGNFCRMRRRISKKGRDSACLMLSNMSRSSRLPHYAPICQVWVWILRLVGMSLLLGIAMPSWKSMRSQKSTAAAKKQSRTIPPTPNSGRYLMGRARVRRCARWASDQAEAGTRSPGETRAMFKCDVNVYTRETYYGCGAGRRRV